MRQWQQLEANITRDAAQSEKITPFLSDFTQGVPFAFEAFRQILDQSRKNFAVLGLISDPSHKDLDELGDPKLGFSLLARELYHQPSIILVKRIRQQSAQSSSEEDVYDSFREPHDELEAIRDFITQLFEKITGMPIHTIPRCVFHLMCKYRIEASTCLNEERKEFLLDVSERLAHVSVDITDDWTLDDVRMMVKGYAALILDRTRKGLIPPSTEGMQKYASWAYDLFNEERDPLLPSD